MSKYCLFLIVIYYLTGGNNSMSRFFKFGKLHVTKGNGDKLLDILLTASKKLKRSLAPTGKEGDWQYGNFQSPSPCQSFSLVSLAKREKQLLIIPESQPWLSQ